VLNAAGSVPEGTVIRVTATVNGKVSGEATFTVKTPTGATVYSANVAAGASLDMRTVLSVTFKDGHKEFPYTGNDVVWTSNNTGIGTFSGNTLTINGGATAGAEFTVRAVVGGAATSNWATVRVAPGGTINTVSVNDGWVPAGESYDMTARLTVGFINPTSDYVGNYPGLVQWEIVNYNGLTTAQVYFGTGANANKLYVASGVADWSTVWVTATVNGKTSSAATVTVGESPYELIGRDLSIDSEMWRAIAQKDDYYLIVSVQPYMSLEDYYYWDYVQGYANSTARDAINAWYTEYTQNNAHPTIKQAAMTNTAVIASDVWFYAWYDQGDGTFINDFGEEGSVAMRNMSAPLEPAGETTTDIAFILSSTETGLFCDLGYVDPYGDVYWPEDYLAYENARSLVPSLSGWDYLRNNFRHIGYSYPRAMATRRGVDTDQWSFGEGYSGQPVLRPALWVNAAIVNAVQP
jgi:hypothetical protein